MSTCSLICWCGLVLFFGCSRSAPTPTTTAAAAPASSRSSDRATVVGSAPAGTVVTLEAVVVRETPQPAGPAILDQISRTFVPDVLLVRVGQRVEFRNSEDVDHNVAVVRSPTGARVFDTATPPFQKYEHTFDRPGRYEVSCDVHPGMRATIVATSAAHAVVADTAGRFTLADVEPGAYKLALSTTTRTSERTIDVTEGRLDLGVLRP